MDEIFPHGCDQFDRLYLDGATTPRIKYLEMLYDRIMCHEGVVMWTGAEILEWHQRQTAG